MRFLTLSLRVFFFLPLALEIASVASLLRRSEDSLTGISSSGILVAVLLFRSSLSSDSSRVSFPAPCLVTLPQSFRTFSGLGSLLLFRSDCELRLSFLRLLPEDLFLEGLSFRRLPFGFSMGKPYPCSAKDAHRAGLFSPALSVSNPAASYSPRDPRPKYHRRWWA